MNDYAPRANAQAKKSNDLPLFQLSGPVDPAAQYGRVAALGVRARYRPDEYLKVMGDIYRETNGWATDPLDVNIGRLKPLNFQASLRQRKLPMIEARAEAFVDAGPPEAVLGAL
jgi:hypothetical protein